MTVRMYKEDAGNVMQKDIWSEGLQPPYTDVIIALRLLLLTPLTLDPLMRTFQLSSTCFSTGLQD